EQWTENPCVPGSIPGGTTQKSLLQNVKGFFYCIKGDKYYCELIHVLHNLNGRHLKSKAHLNLSLNKTALFLNNYHYLCSRFKVSRIKYTHYEHEKDC
ncbi:MAG: hypothetical protein ACOVRN_16150, partial [Flavobacterium sp.]